jgi:hypothetical protein
MKIYIFADFKYSSRLGRLERVVQTSSCNIPDFDTFDEDVLRFIKIAQPVEKCNVTHFNWSYVKGTVRNIYAIIIKPHKTIEYSRN